MPTFKGFVLNSSCCRAITTRVSVGRTNKISSTIVLITLTIYIAAAASTTTTNTGGTTITIYLFFDQY